MNPLASSPPIFVKSASTQVQKDENKQDSTPYQTFNKFGYELNEEEDLNREEILEEMRRHSRLATATQPINIASTKLSEVEADIQ